MQIIKTAFAPANITGIFAIFPNGSAGSGVMLDHGATTSVDVTDGESSVSIEINSNKLTDAPVTKEVLKAYEYFLVNKAVSISTTTDFPIGYGFGMSGAGSFSTSIALNEALKSGYTYKECMEIATKAEIACGTGIGTVKTQQYYGFIIGKKPYPSNVAEIIPCEEDTVVCAFLEPIETGSIIKDPIWKEKITRIGLECLEELDVNRTIPKLLEMARKFTFETGLAGPKLKELLNRVPNASMAMLGQTAFTVVKKEEAESIANIFKEYTDIVKVVGLGKRAAGLN